MKITERVKTIVGVDDASWDGEQRKLTVYHHDDRNAMKVKVAHMLRQNDVIDFIDKIILISY